jgi:hypothetical protein
MTRRMGLLALPLVVQLLAGSSSDALQGRVVDAVTHQGLADAIVTVGDTVVTSDAQGRFMIGGRGTSVGVRAYGHGRAFVPRAAFDYPGVNVALTPIQPKALYLSSLGVADRSLRGAALRIAQASEINALVVDLKSDRGQVGFRTNVPLAQAIGAERAPVIGDLKALTDSLHQQGLYSIARIVVFKDDALALARPALAVRTVGGAIWHDRDGIAWTDPSLPEVWNYNIDLAVEAARSGFDEIQFDYVRFPDAKGLALPSSRTQATRVAAISGFLALARRRLAPYNVFIAADAFGYVCWNLDDTGVGQTLTTLLPWVDYLSPMLYPSSFQFGIPGVRDPVAHTYDVVYRSLEEALGRTRVPAVRLRPWLQAFSDYAFGHGAFSGAQIRAQISAAEHAGTDGWMLWNPRNVYSLQGLAPKPPLDSEEPAAP